MALTLAEGAKLSNDVLLQGVIETIIKDSPILQMLPFISIVGNGLTYNQEKTLPAATWHAVNGDWVDSPAEFTQLTATLKILGGNATVDNFLKTTRSNVQDLEAVVIEMKAKSIRHEFENTFINGDTGVDANQYDGLYKLLALGDQQIWADGSANGTAGAALSFGMLDKLIDLVKGGKPDLLLMSRRSRRELQGLMRASGVVLETRPGMFGEQVQMYNGIPVGISDWQLDNNLVGSDGDCTNIYALSFGEGALCGLTSPEGLQVEKIGAMEGKDADLTRVKWYVSLALFTEVKAGLLSGVKAS